MPRLSPAARAARISQLRQFWARSLYTYRRNDIATACNSLRANAESTTIRVAWRQAVAYYASDYSLHLLRALFGVSRHALTEARERARSRRDRDRQNNAYRATTFAERFKAWRKERHCPDCDALTLDEDGDPLPRCECCNECSECCECHVCSHCGSSCESLCELCERCDDCCYNRGNCHTCSRRRCGERVSSDRYCTDCDCCHDCCECIHCENCGDECNETYCSECNQCESCCDCIRCGRCGEIVESRCEECNRCEDCECSCGGDGTMRHEGAWGDHRARKEGDPVLGPYVHFPLRRTVGVEWETEKADPRKILDAVREWRIGVHKDGSVSGPEMVTPILAGDAIAGCCEAMARAHIEDNSGCGVHVHVDASDLSDDKLVRLMRAHQHVERVLYAIAGQKRRDNSYCQPLESADLTTIDKIRAFYESPHKGGDKKGNYSAKRYFALNMMPVLRGYATVEWRMHRRAEGDGERVANWAMLCAQIVEWASHSTPASLAKLLAMTPTRALRALAPLSLGFVAKRLASWRRFYSNHTDKPRGGRSNRLALDPNRRERWAAENARISARVRARKAAIETLLIAATLAAA